MGGDKALHNEKPCRCIVKRSGEAWSQATRCHLFTMQSSFQSAPMSLFRSLKRAVRHCKCKWLTATHIFSTHKGQHRASRLEDDKSKRQRREGSKVALRPSKGSSRMSCGAVVAAVGYV